MARPPKKLWLTPTAAVGLYDLQRGQGAARHFRSSHVVVTAWPPGLVLLLTGCDSWPVPSELSLPAWALQEAGRSARHGVRRPSPLSEQPKSVGCPQPLHCFLGSCVSLRRGCAGPVVSTVRTTLNQNFTSVSQNPA